MTSNTTIIIIIVVIAIAAYLIYSQNSQKNQIALPQLNNHNNHNTNAPCQNCDLYKKELDRFLSSPHHSDQPINVTIDNDNDPYSDTIKKQDLYGMYDPLTYPQMRLPRDILEKYQEYYEKNGVYPPFNQPTQPIFDNPILNGLLIKETDENDPFTDDTPASVPLFRVKSSKNTNRFFYYIVEQRYLSKLELKIPLDNIKINGTRYNNADFYGLPELYDGDLIENIPIYPNNRFKVTIYKTYHFP